MYPNVLLGVHRDHAFAIILIPEAPEQTTERVHLLYPKKDIDRALQKKNRDQWKDIFKEDIFVVKGMQRGRQSIAFDGRKFSPVMDGPTPCFHDWVASQIDKYQGLQNASK